MLNEPLIFNIIRFLCRWRVRAGFIVLPAIIILAEPTPVSLMTGVIISLIGLLIRHWASGHLIKEKKLANSGPYRYTRNPLYLGSFILGIGITAGAYSWWVLVIFTAYFLIFYPAVIIRERERMKELFPEDYSVYRKKVPLFFPSLESNFKSRQKFDWKLYRKNKEYRAQLSTLIFWLIIAGKMLLFP